MRPLNKPLPRQIYVEDYDALRRLLVEVTGPYCAYCESPVSVDMPVEHKAAKFDGENRKAAKFFTVNNRNFFDSGFPDHAIQWRNLLIACDSCNTIKNAAPGQEEARNYLFLYGSQNSYLTDDTEQLYMAALKWCVWPDACPNSNSQPAPPVDDTYRYFTFEYTSKSQVELANAGLLPQPSSTTAAWATTRYQKVWVIPNNNYISTLQNQAEVRYRVLNSINMLKLNRYIQGDPNANDRRTQNRTNTYLLALDALSDLGTIVSSVHFVINVGEVTTMVESIRDTAMATGFWCVWTWVFSTAFKNPNDPVWSKVHDDDKQELFNYLFKIYMAGERLAGNAVPLFTGTDLSRIPDLF